MSAPPVDRPWRCPRDHTCPNKTAHDTYSAYRHGCRSGLATDEYLRYTKRQKAGILVPRNVSSIGVARRLQALTALGWSNDDLAAELGQHRSRVSRLRAGERTLARVTTATRIAEAYERLQHTPGTSRTSAKRAQTRGWVLPIAWEGIDIDDPDAQPWTPETHGAEHDEGAGDGGVVAAALALGLHWDRLSEDNRTELLDGLYTRLGAVELADRVRTRPDVIRRAWDRLGSLRRRRAALERIAAAEAASECGEDEETAA